MTGQIIKLYGNKYVVHDGENSFLLGARGVLKIKSDGLVVGDFVEFDKNNITKVLDRHSYFIRPNVSNIDAVLLVVSPVPKPDFIMFDKLIVNCQKAGVEVYFAVNKTDLDETLIDTIKEQYGKIDVKIFEVCAKNGKGIEELKKELKGKLTAFAGQSAVGKTSLINKMFSLNLKTGDLSEKVLRGKHTTTRSEIFFIGDIKVIDTPGFATFDANVSYKELNEYYTEYFELSSGCKFRGCNHVNEPLCKVKQAVECGNLSKERYERYLQIYKELKEKENGY